MPDSSLPIKSIVADTSHAAECWALTIVAIAYWGNTVRTAAHPGASGLALVTGGVLQNGAYCAAAWAMLVATAWRELQAARSRAPHLSLLTAACLIAAIPARQGAMVAMLLLVIHFARFTARHGAALLLFGLAAETFWTSPYLLPLHAAVGRIDATLVRALVGGSGRDNLVTIGSNNFNIEILAACASSYPLAAVALAYSVVRLLDRQLPGRRDVPWLLLALLISICLTEARLALMARSAASYVWLHEGGGVTLYTLLATISAFLVPALAGFTPNRAPRQV